MASFYETFKRKVCTSVFKDEQTHPARSKEIDAKIAFGVLLWIVAQADKKFLAAEEEKIKEIIKTSANITSDELELVVNSVIEAERERVDLYEFTHELSDILAYSAKVAVVEDLFRVACSDKELDESEVETIRNISHLFNVAHKDFINAKIKVKKEFGLDTAGL